MLQYFNLAKNLSQISGMARPAAIKSDTPAQTHTGLRASAFCKYILRLLETSKREIERHAQKGNNL